MKTNIYLKALEIGYNSQNEGISYDNLKSKLEALNYECDWFAFKRWYYWNFETPNTIALKTRENFVPIPEYDSDAYPLGSEALMQYIEFIELKEARQTSTRALVLSIIAITVSVIGAAVSFFIPPDVNVISNDKENKVEVRAFVTGDSNFVINEMHGCTLWANESDTTITETITDSTSSPNTVKRVEKRIIRKRSK